MGEPGGICPLLGGLPERLPLLLGRMVRALGGARRARISVRAASDITRASKDRAGHSTISRRGASQKEVKALGERKGLRRRRGLARNVTERAALYKKRKEEAGGRQNASACPMGKGADERDVKMEEHGAKTARRRRNEKPAGYGLLGIEESAPSRQSPDSVKRGQLEQRARAWGWAACSAKMRVGPGIRSRAKHGRHHTHFARAQPRGEAGHSYQDLRTNAVLGKEKSLGKGEGLPF